MLPRLLSSALTAAALTLSVVALPGAAQAGNVTTPGDFTGYGFDQCVAPTQKTMNKWLKHSPYLAVGIYTSGASRGCRSQPNLTPTWVSTQLRKGWRLLPISLGPQASCHPSFPRYGNDPTIDPSPGRNGRYSKARKQGTAEANTSVAAAGALGIVAGSTLWYDLEGFDLKKTTCRESALYFVSAWVTQVKARGYVAGVYSSAGSGIKMLDDARIERPGMFTLPDRIWIARWDGAANTSTSYIREDGWRPGGRMKQYRGGHDEVHGGVRINIDSNFLELGRGSVGSTESHCGGVAVSFPNYQKIGKGTARGAMVSALECLLKEKGAFSGAVDRTYDDATAAAARAWQASHGITPTTKWRRADWVALLANGPRTVVKYGSVGAPVHRLQRALNAAGKATLPVTGVMDSATVIALRAYQSKVRTATTGVAPPKTWKLLQTGRRR